MARQTTGRLTITGELVAQTPLHVGGYGDDVDTDLPLARNGAGQLYVPGTSLAGALRAWCESAFGDATRDVWGFQKDDDGFAGYVFVEDAIVLGGCDHLVEIRDGVGIDREWGCAAEQIKYDRAVLPRGTRLPLAMTVEYTSAQRQRTVEMFQTLAAALCAGEVRLGAAKSRGLGKVKLDGDEVDVVREHTLNTPDGILTLLRSRGGEGEPVEKVSPSLCKLKRPRLDIEITWRPLGPLMVKAGADGIGVDSVPLVSGVDGQVTLVLPGSSIKGTIRNQAERIARTLLGTTLGKVDNPKRRFLKHLTEVPLISAVFGAAGERRRRENDARDPSADVEAASRLGLGAFSADDCYGTPRIRITREQWQAIVAAAIAPTPGERESALRRALDGAGLQHWTAAFHVAVDRWTGGAAENLLYNVLEPHAVPWEPLKLALDLKRLQSAYHWPEPEGYLVGVMIVLLTLRDLAKGRVPLGFATHRGMGAVAVESVHISGRDLPEELRELATPVELPNGDFGVLPEAVRKQLQDVWQRWLGRCSTTPETEVKA